MHDTTPTIFPAGFARHAALNTAAMAFPIALAFLLAPTIVNALGVERFGILALIWGLFNYFTVMDLGLGRALTLAVSTRVNTRREVEIFSALKWSATFIGGIGVVIALLGWFAAPSLVSSTLRIPTDHLEESIRAIQISMACLPIVALCSVLNGYLAGLERFDLINAVKVPLFAATLLAPVVGMHDESPILASTTVMVLVRIVASLALVWLCCAGERRRFMRQTERFRDLGDLLRFGGWLSVLNITNTLLAYIDRWALAAWASLAMVTYYTLPLEVATKLLIVPSSIATVLFPIFCRQSVSHTSGDTRQLLFSGTLLIAAVCFLFAMLLSLFGRELLTVWLGTEFGSKGALALQVLAAGTFINAIAHPAATLLQTRGHTRSLVIALFAELPPFVLALWLLVPSMGATGAALAWLLRVTMDAAVLWYLARISVGETDHPSFAMPMAAALTLLALSMFIAVPVYKTGLLVVSATGAVLYLIHALRRRENRHFDTTVTHEALALRDHRLS